MAAFAAARIWSSGSGFSGCGTMASRRRETFEVQDGSGQHFEDFREQGHRRHLVPLQFYGVVQDPPRARPACPDPDHHRVAGAGQPLQLMRGQGLSGGDLDLDNLGNAVIGVEGPAQFLGQHVHAVPAVVNDADRPGCGIKTATIGLTSLLNPAGYEWPRVSSRAMTSCWIWLVPS